MQGREYKSMKRLYFNLCVYKGWKKRWYGDQQAWQEEKHEGSEMVYSVEFWVCSPFLQSLPVNWLFEFRWTRRRKEQKTKEKREKGDKDGKDKEEEEEGSFLFLHPSLLSLELTTGSVMLTTLPWIMYRRFQCSHSTADALLAKTDRTIFCLWQNSEMYQTAAKENAWGRMARLLSHNLQSLKRRRVCLSAACLFSSTPRKASHNLGRNLLRNSGGIRDWIGGPVDVGTVGTWSQCC